LPGFLTGFRAGFFLPAFRLALLAAALRTTFFFATFFFPTFFFVAFFFAAFFLAFAMGTSVTVNLRQRIAPSGTTRLSLLC
jgi:hypothetical protein